MNSNQMSLRDITLIYKNVTGTFDFRRLHLTWNTRTHEGEDNPEVPQQELPSEHAVSVRRRDFMEQHAAKRMSTADAR